MLRPDIGKATLTIMTAEQSSHDMRQRILDESARLFSQNGIASTSMREIAKECGIQAGSLYYHFKSKDEIIAEVLELGISFVADAVKAELEKLDRSAGFRERFHAAVLAHLNAFFLHRNYTATHIREFKQAPASTRIKNIKTRDAYEQLWADLFAIGVSEGVLATDIDLRFARLLLLSSMNWALEWFKPKGQRSFDELTVTIVRIFLDGCTARAAYTHDGSPAMASEQAADR